MEKTAVPARTRMAPSPTGEYHIGHIRTLLYNYALAKQSGGQFIIRIEDTDQKRLVPGAMERILEVIKDYGLSWNEGPDVGGPYAPYIQTQRLDIYKKYIEELIAKGGAYYCFCTAERLDQMRETQKAAKQVPKYDRHCLNLSKEEIDENLKKGVPYVVRLKIPQNRTIIFNDLVRGQIKFNTNDVDDQVLIKSNGIPTYHFAAGVDDHLMGITHVLRGEEWISSVPKQVVMYEYFGWELPQFAHLTVFLDPDGKGKMSKRHGSVSARSFLDAGYLPEALLNFLMLLGWNPGIEQEFFTLDEFVKTFSLEHLHVKQPIFDRKKLDYFNGYYIRQKSDEELSKLLAPFLPKMDKETIKKVAPLIKERISKLSDASELTRFMYEDVNYDRELLLQKGLDENLAKDMLSGAMDVLNAENNWEAEAIQKDLLELIAQKEWHTGKFFMVFRAAVAGAPITPPIVESLPIIGKEKTLARLKAALAKL